LDESLVINKERQICRALVPHMLSEMGLDCSPEGIGGLAETIMGLGFSRKDAVQTASSLIHEAIDISSVALERELEEEAREAEEAAMAMPDGNVCK
jgi:hypothetical protein